MSFLFALIVLFFLVVVFYIIGHLACKFINISEKSKLLYFLVKIAVGISLFLITINLFGRLTRDFNIGLVVTFILCIVVIGWQFNEFKQTLINLKQFLTKDDLTNFFKENTDKYFWILIGVINFIYGITAFSTINLDRFGVGNKHIFNINQLLAGTYPPKYSFLPNLDQQYHYGADIFGAILTKFSGTHPEFSLDILTLLFLNLTILTLYTLSIKFLGSNKLNKYLVPFVALLGWGPITTLFSKTPGEIIPKNFLEKIQYLTQTRLTDSANWTGLALHWFFAPPVMIGVFFLLISLYLIFNFLNNKNTITSVLFLSLFLSSLEIIDITKFIVVMIALAIYVIITLPLPIFEDIKDTDKTDLTYLSKSFGLLFLSIFIFCFIHGNWFTVDKSFVSPLSFYKLGTSNLPAVFSPLKVNFILLAIFAFGFYQAYKQKDKWLTFLFTYFLTSMILPFFLTIPNAGIGKLFMTGNVIGAFSLPFTVDFIKNRLNLKEEKIKIFYTLIFILLSFSTLMYWAFGSFSNKEKSLFTLENGRLKSNGKQVYPFDNKSEEFVFAKKLRSNKFKDSTILSDPQYGEILAVNSGLFSLLPNITNFNEEVPVKKEFIDSTAAKLNSLYAFNSKLLKEQKIRTLYLTPKLIRYLLSPKARQTLLAAELSGNGKVIHSNKKEDLTQLKEIYFIDPKKLTYDSIPNYGKRLKAYLKSIGSKDPKNNYSMYLKQIAECPYYGIYNAMSNDFDGDMISDVAFFDYASKKWTIIYGKDQKEEEIDLNNSIFANYNGDLLVPVPSDYDGDSKTDIAFFDENNGRWYIRRSSDLQIDSGKQFGVYIEEIPLPADVDGDLKTDPSCFNSNHGTWYSGATTKGFYQNNFGLSPLDIPVFADIDGDKQADYVIYKPDTNLLEAYLSTKSFNKFDHLKLIIGNKNSRLVPADYDGDGKVDLALWTPSTGEWEIAYAKDLLISNIISGSPPPAFVGCGVPPQPQGETPTPLCATKKFKLGRAGDIPMPGDYNGDGINEIAVYNTSTGWLEIFFNNGTKRKIDLSKYRGLTLASFIGV